MYLDGLESERLGDAVDPSPWTRKAGTDEEGRTGEIQDQLRVAVLIRTWRATTMELGGEEGPQDGQPDRPGVQGWQSGDPPLDRATMRDSELQRSLTNLCTSVSYRTTAVP